MAFVSIVLLVFLSQTRRAAEQTRKAMFARYSDLLDRFMEGDLRKLKQAQKIEKREPDPEAGEAKRPEEMEYVITDDGREMPLYMGSNL
jgi:hypothetical protein